MHVLRSALFHRQLRLELALLTALTAPALADDIGFQRYFDHNEFSLTSPGAQKFGLPY